MAVSHPRVVALLTDGMWSHDVANVIQVFAGSLATGGENPCDFSFLSEHGHVELDHRVSVECEPLSEFSGIADLICIPGFTNPFSLDESLFDSYERVSDWTGLVAPSSSISPDVAEWLAVQHRASARFVTLGTGVYLLAVVGLLDKVRCTTHWLFAPELQRRFPAALVDAERMLVYDEQARIRSSAGGASGLDACLAALMDVVGHASASVVARAMNLWSPHSLEAKQEAFGLHGGATSDYEDPILRLKETVSCHLEHGWSVAEMAWYAGMSARTLQRRFLEVEGQTPARWLVSEQMMYAARLLEETDLSLTAIAARVGISGPDVLRRNFARCYGESPRAYRKRFMAM